MFTHSFYVSRAKSFSIHLVPTIPTNPIYLYYLYIHEILHPNGLGKMLVVLRDGRKLHGVLRSYDQFGTCTFFFFRSLFFQKTNQPTFVLANLVLEDTVERIYHGDSYAENWHGLFLIRGENVVLLGEIVCFFLFCLKQSMTKKRDD